MVISHRYKYVFIELPNTATTAIHKELCEQYEGIPILHPKVGRHITYPEFLKIASDQERDYFVLSCIRNPLDVVVTNYFKHRNNQGGVFTNPQMWKRNGGWVTDYDLRRFRFIHKTGADFAVYFRKYYRFPPYDNWSSLSHKQFDFVIRFERLQGDFAQCLRLLGIEPKRPLPVANKTAGKKRDFWSYYVPEIQGQAKRVFGPFMHKWGYEFPPEWGDSSVPWSSQVLFHISGFFRRHLEWGSSLGTRFFAKLAGL